MPRLNFSYNGGSYVSPRFSKFRNLLVRVRLIRLWFVIHKEVLNFHDWILCYHQPFHDNIKKTEKYQLIYIYIFEITIYVKPMWNTLSYETLNYVAFVLLSSIYTFRVVYNWALSNLKSLDLKFPQSNHNLYSLEIERVVNWTNAFLFIG